MRCAGRGVTGMHSDTELEYLVDTLHNIDILPDAMMPSEFDGLVAGVLLCPEPISPKDWVPMVLGSPEDLMELDAIEAQVILDVLLAHYNRVAENFIAKATPYEAMIAFEDEDEPLWEQWVAGFSTIINCKPEAFEQYATAEKRHAAEAFGGVKMLIDYAYGELDLPDEDLIAIDNTAPDLIPSIVVHMHLWLEQFAAPNGPLADLAWDEVMMPLRRKTRH